MQPLQKCELTVVHEYYQHILNFICNEIYLNNYQMILQSLCVGKIVKK